MMPSTAHLYKIPAAIEVHGSFTCRRMLFCARIDGHLDATNLRLQFAMAEETLVAPPKPTGLCKSPNEEI